MHAADTGFGNVVRTWLEDGGGSAIAGVTDLTATWQCGLLSTLKMLLTIIDVIEPG